MPVACPRAFGTQRYRVCLSRVCRWANGGVTQWELIGRNMLADDVRAVGAVRAVGRAGQLSGPIVGRRVAAPETVRVCMETDLR